MRFLHAAYLFLAALWCGALTFFAVAGARIVLTESISRAAGGTVNRALLDALDVASYGAIALLFVLFIALDRASPFTRLARGATFRLLVLASAAAFVSHLVITPEMVALRDRLPMSLDVLAPNDPLRRDWGRLHALSSVALVLRILCAAGLFTAAFSPFRGDRSWGPPPEPFVMRPPQSN